jgi:hypothetical protein
MLQIRKDYSATNIQYQALLAAEIQALGTDHTDTLVTKFRLAQIAHASGACSAEETLTTYSEILAKQEELVGEEDARSRTVRKERDYLAERINSRTIPSG